MRIAVFGGTGKTGWLAVRYAVDKVYGCKVLTRNPERMPSVPGVEFIEGSSINGGRVMLTLTGCDAVLVALRGGKKAPEGFLFKSVSHILSGMRKLEIPRIVLLSSMAAGDTFFNVPLSRRLFSSSVNKRELEDLTRTEEMLRESEVEWTIIRPAFLTEDEEKSSYTVSTDRTIQAKTIGREDLARFAVEEIEKGEYIHRILCVSK